MAERAGLILKHDMIDDIFRNGTKDGKNLTFGEFAQIMKTENKCT